MDSPNSHLQQSLAHELDEIRQQQTLLLTLLDHTHAGVVVHGADGRVRYINSSARAIFGIKLATMIHAAIVRADR